MSEARSEDQEERAAATGAPSPPLSREQALSPEVGEPETQEPAPARRGLIRESDLDELLPQRDRRAGAWQPGVGTLPVTGGDWGDVDLSRQGTGMQTTAAQHQRNWDDAIASVRAWSPEQAAWLDKYLADHPEVGPGDREFWSRALGQIDRSRYWYEGSTRAFAEHGLTDQHPDDATLGFRVMAGTSGSAEPEPNTRRALGVLAEHQQGLPSAMDLVSPGSVRLAFAGPRIASPKFGNFGSTFAHLAGIEDKIPVSTNDRQVADIHGISAEDLAKHPALYGLLSHYYQNFRDSENAARPGVAAREENPYETWQLQALGWNQVRGEKRESKVGEAGVDDYAQVMDRLRDELIGHGVDARRGIFRPEVLEDERVPNLMSTTRQRFLESPVATVEVGTTRTPEGARAAQLYDQLPSDARWADVARAEMEGNHRRAFRALGSAGKGPSVLDRLTSAIVGEPVEVRRVDNGGWGQFGDAISPNMRIPMWARRTSGPNAGERITLQPDQINALLASLGHDFEQQAMAASRFRTITPEDRAAGVVPQTHSVFLSEHGRPLTPLDQLDRFGRILGLPLSITRGPTGTLADINVGGAAGPPPTRDQVVAAARQAFGDDVESHVIPKAYSGHYLEHPEEASSPLTSYDAHLNDFWARQHAGDLARVAQPRGVRGTYWDAARRSSDFAAARAATREIAAAYDADTKKWSDKYEARIANPGAPGRRLRPLPTPELQGGVGGATSAAAQAPQPPPSGGLRLIPIEHDPFSEAP